MTNEQQLFKSLSDYFGLNLNDFDKGKVLGYVNEYVGSLPQESPQVITKIKTVYKYLSEDLKEKLNEGTEDAIIVKPSEIIEMVTKLTKVTYKEMLSKNRQFDIIVARHTAMYFINKISHETLKGTGILFNRDHTSVINAVRNVRNMMEGNHSKYVSLFEAVSNKISTYAIKKTA